MTEPILNDKFTYQDKPLSDRLEKYEWDRMWIEDTTDKTSKRILYIGASTSAKIFPHATEASGRSIIFNSFATSKALDNPYYYPAVKSFIKQCNRRDAIILQNGLHGWHLTEEEYGELYFELMRAIKEDFPGVPVFVALTTAVSESAFNSHRVLPRNEQTRLAAERADVEVIDLYSVALENLELLSSDGLHFTEEGYRRLGIALYTFLHERI